MTTNNKQQKKIRDIEPFEHGEEGTHYACQKMIKKYGDKVTCCGCRNHKCDVDL